MASISSATARPISRRADRRLALLQAVGVGSLLLLAIPTYWDIARDVWSGTEQSHGGVILALAVWLFSRSFYRIQHLTAKGAPVVGYTLLTVAGLMYAVGRSQAVVQLEGLGVILFAVAVLILIYGPSAFRLVWFPFFLLLFTIPLPGLMVQTITAPMKAGVSYVAELILYAIEYPISRTGVILIVGQYQLLVADACAGLNSLFTLEAIGLVYLQLMQYASRARNIALAVAVVPCAFLANVVRVCVLVLVTYHYGDEAAQGFIHNFAGILLFVVATVAIISVDKVFSLFFSSAEAVRPVPQRA